MAYSVTSPERVAELRVLVAGIHLANVLSVNISFSLSAPVPTAEVVIAGGLPSWVKRGDGVAIELSGRRLFTGQVKVRRREVGQGRLACVGKTSMLWRPYKVAGWVFQNVTARAAVESILDEVGITDRSLDIADWTIGTRRPAVLDMTTPGDAVMKIIDVDGHRLYETPTGTLVIRKLLEVPAARPARTYSTTGTAPWVLDMRDDEDEDQAKKRVYVLGAALPEVDSEGNEIQVQVRAEALTLDDSIVPGNPELYSMTYNNDLIETNEKAAEVALRLLDKHHRVLERIELTAPLDPDIQLAMTVQIQDDAITGRRGLWFVSDYTHSISGSEITTRMTLTGGDRSGTQGLLAPMADFWWIAEREVVGNKEMVVVQLIDQSSDLDGTISNYRWQDDYAGGAMDQSGATLRRITRAYDPTIDGEVTVTLTVTDSDGLMRSATKRIDLRRISGRDDMHLNETAVAAKNTAMLTVDGGLTWTDQSGAWLSGDLISATLVRIDSPDTPNVLIVGTSTGRIYRSSDRLATAPVLVLQDPDGAPITRVHWSDDPTRPQDVWAGTSDGKLYRSTDGGQTWSLFKAFGTTQPIYDIGTPQGRVIVFGGRADFPETLIQYCDLSDPFTWRSASRTFPAGSAAWHIRRARTNDWKEYLLGFGGGRYPPLVYTPDLWAPTPEWREAQGLPSGLTSFRSLEANNGRIGSFIAVFDSKDVWVTEDGQNWTQRPGVIPGSASNRPYDLHVVPGFQDCHLLGTVEGVYKSLNMGANWSSFRPAAGISSWPAGAEARQITVRLRPGTGAVSLDEVLVIVRQGSTSGPYFLLRRTVTGSWAVVNSNLPGNPRRLRAYPWGGSFVLFYCDLQSSESDFRVWGPLRRSTDGGQTWSPVLDRCAAIDRGPDGTLWATTHSTEMAGTSEPRWWYVYKSTDGGATWQQVATLDMDVSGGAGTDVVSLTTIAVDPSNAKRIFLSGAAFGVPGGSHAHAISTDGGATWTIRKSDAMIADSISSYTHAVWGANGRVLKTQFQQPPDIYRSDDLGASWAEAFNTGSLTSGDRWYHALRVGLSTIFFAGGHFRSDSINWLLRSRDNGQTFERLDSLLPVSQYPNLEVMGLAVSPDGNRLYAVLDLSSPSQRTAVYVIQPPNGDSPTATDITGNLATVVGGSTNRPFQQPIAVIPA